MFRTDSRGPLYLAYVSSPPLFPDPWVAAPPPGVQVLRDWVTEEQEAELLAAVAGSGGQQGELKQRQVRTVMLWFAPHRNVGPRCSTGGSSSGIPTPPSPPPPSPPSHPPVRCILLCWRWCCTVSCRR